MHRLDDGHHNHNIEQQHFRILSPVHAVTFNLELGNLIYNNAFYLKLK